MILFRVGLGFLLCLAFAGSVEAFEITRKTNLAKVTLLFAEFPRDESVRAARFWPTLDGPGTNQLRYPALVGITYTTERGTFQFPAHLVAGIGALDLDVLANNRVAGLIVRDFGENVMIALSVSDGASSYEVEWRLWPQKGWIVRFARDNLLQGKTGTPEGPEVLSGQAERQKPARAVPSVARGAEAPPTYTVSVKQLLDTPEEFAGRRVDVTGYYRIFIHESCLLMCESCIDEYGTERSIWLSTVVWSPYFSPRRPRNVAKSGAVENRMVRVIGTFHYEPRPDRGQGVPYMFRRRGFGSYSMWNREIGEITYIQPAR
jgi:hypothetical protein